MVAFLEQQQNTNTSRKGFPINMYLGEPPHKLYFIAMTLQGQIIIGPNKKVVASYVVGNLALLD